MGTQFTDQTFPKVELHVHLEGAIRPATIWELSQKRGIDVGATSLKELKQHLVEWEIGDLTTFLEQFNRFMPVLAGSYDIAKRVSYELCEDLAKQGVVYFETRYNPHLFANAPAELPRVFGQPEGTLTARDVVRAVNEGIREGERDFGVKARTILCMLRERPEWSSEIFELCKEFHNDTVVGIDLANDESIKLYNEHVDAFQNAAKAGIHRTCHAAEMGPSDNVRIAVERLSAERIGHGYQMVDDESVIKLVKNNWIHLEVCPTSSIRTGAQKTGFMKHSIKRFLAEGLNISINTDDPTLFGTTLTSEYGISRKDFGMDDQALALMTLNAARACFLPDEERTKLVADLRDKFRTILRE